MKLLLDTHVIIWALTDDPRLSENARSLIAAPENMVFYSTASLWEIAVKNQKSPEKCPYHEQEIMEFCEQAGYLSLNILPRHVLALRGLTVQEDHYLSNTDPFDRILLAQAKTEDCLFITHDGNFENYAENRIRLI